MPRVPTIRAPSRLSPVASKSPGGRGRGASPLAADCRRTADEIRRAFFQPGRHPLHAAVVNKDQAAIHDCLGLGHTLSEIAPQSGCAPLHLAVANSGLEIVRLLVSLGADPAQPDARGWTPLHFACAASSPAVVAALLEAGAPLSACDQSGFIAAHFAAARGRTAILELLLRDEQAAADLANWRNKDGLTPVHLAARLPLVATVAALLASGGRSDSKDRRGWTPVHEAIAHGNSETLSVLMESFSGEAPPLDLAMLRDSRSCFALLVEMGGAESCSEATVADCARLNAVGCLRHLLDRGFASERPVDGNWSALHEAAFAGSLDCVRLLVQRGHAVDLPDAAGNLPVHLAAREGHSTVCAELLRTASGGYFRNGEGQTPLLVAIAHGNYECARAIAGHVPLINTAWSLPAWIGTEIAAIQDALESDDDSQLAGVATRRAAAKLAAALMAHVKVHKM